MRERNLTPNDNRLTKKAPRRLSEEDMIGPHIAVMEAQALQDFDSDGNPILSDIVYSLGWSNEMDFQGVAYFEDDVYDCYTLDGFYGKYQIPLYMDGARLGYGLAASKDVTLKDIARLCDVFYIGGTKVGAMFGEAVVTAHPELLPRFFTFVKQHGAMLAKGRLLGVQFSTLFTDNLYFEIAGNAVQQALRLKKAMIAKGFSPYVDSPTNQQFFCLPKKEIDRISKFASFEIWAPCGPQQSVVRFVTSWNTTAADIDEFISKL